MSVWQVFTLISQDTLLFYHFQVIDLCFGLCAYPGNEEVKLAILSCFASWAARCADAIDPGVVSFITNGLKEKETLRKGHLRCVRLICKNIDAVPRVKEIYLVFYLPHYIGFLGFHYIYII